jgi:peptidoglycan hydrolase-like protein with peptidoglycan-binding domain
MIGYTSMSHGLGGLLPLGELGTGTDPGSVLVPGSVSLGAMFDPGTMPKLLAIPAAGKAKTTAHAEGQRGLVAFFAKTPVKDPTSSSRLVYPSSEVDGMIGPRTQKATWAFQRWANAVMRAGLSEDGLFGPMTYEAIAKALTIAPPPAATLPSIPTAPAIPGAPSSTPSAPAAPSPATKEEGSNVAGPILAMAGGLGVAVIGVVAYRRYKRRHHGG